MKLIRFALSLALSACGSAALAVGTDTGTGLTGTTGGYSPGGGLAPTLATLTPTLTPWGDTRGTDLYYGNDARGTDTYGNTRNGRANGNGGFWSRMFGGRSRAWKLVQDHEERIRRAEADGKIDTAQAVGYRNSLQAIKSRYGLESQDDDAGLNDEERRQLKRDLDAETDRLKDVSRRD